MRSAPFWFVLLLGVLFVTAAAETQATPEDESSPTAVDLPRGTLHLESHVVSVSIAPGFATTQVDQILVNQTQQDVSAEWSLPLPEEAALSELSLHADGEELIGEVVEKERARQIHRAEAAAGESAALGEQDGFFYYRVALTKVPAGSRVMARVVYVQPVKTDAGVGRYVYPLREGNTKDDAPSGFWTMERKAEKEFRIDVSLRAAFPIDALNCTSHGGFQSKVVDEGTWKGELSVPGSALDKDFVLYWRLDPETPARVELLTHRRQGDSEGTFLAVVTPGSDLSEIENGTDWAFVLDVSGSMKGEKIRGLQRGVSRAIQALGHADRVHLVSFEATARDVTPGWLEASKGGIAKAVTAVMSLRAGGSTNVFAGLDLAYRRLDADRPAGIILVTDGVANTGPHQYRDLIALAKQHDVRLFTFVMGNSANVTLLKDLATRTGGHSGSISVDGDIAGQLLLAQNRMSHQALHGVEMTLDGATVRYPARLPSLYLGQQLVAVGRYDKTGPATLEVKALVSGKPVTWTLPVNLPEVDASCPELERLYALAAIGDLEREAWLATGNADEASGAITDLAIRYSLVTDYTSMIVLRKDRKAVHGIGDDNARRRAEERKAAAARQRTRHAPQIVTGQRPLAGPRAEHAPSRYARRQGGGGSAPSGGGGGGGLGAIGPLHLIAAAGLGLLAWRRRKKRA